MEGPVTLKLKEKGLDVKFLAWLEGPEDRLPLIDNLRKIKPAELANAIRATEWLASYFAQPELIHPCQPQEWLDRYNRLQQFFVTALRFSGGFYRRVGDSGLQALERVIKAVMPGECGEKYLKGLRNLRGKGQPMKVPPMSARPRKSGGRRQSEQVRRMRAAVKYVSSVSSKPYVDLADFWNECQGERQYYADEVRSKLLKGLVPGARPPGGAQELELWQSVYKGDPWPFFPEPLP